MKLLTLALGLWATTASAAEITVAPFAGDPEGKIIAITVRGEIMAGDNLKLEHAFWRAVGRPGKGVILELVSSGGHTWASEGIALFIHKQGIATLVRGDCVSGCGIIALSAQSLWIASDGRVGLHQAWRDGKDGRPVADIEVTRGAASFLRPYGVPESALQRMLVTGPNEMSFLTEEELTAMGAHINHDVLRASQ